MGDVDVLVVGAGTSGCHLASELGRRGLTVRLVDAAPARAGEGGAALLHGPALARLARVGLDAPLVARGTRLTGVTVVGAGLPIASIDLADPTSLSPFALAVSAAALDEVLAGTLAAAGVEVERGLTLRGLRQDGTGVTATLDAADGTARTIRAAWLVGCDGAASAVRAALDVPLEGDAPEQVHVVAEVTLEASLRDDRVSAFVGDAGALVCVPMGGGRTLLVATDAEGGAGEDGAPSRAALEALVRSRAGLDATIREVAWSTRRRGREAEVARYVDDRVFLAGEAAHPSGAFAVGVDAALEDTEDLAWKLALVHRGGGRGRLLESYHDEARARGRARRMAPEAAARLVVPKAPVSRAARLDAGRLLAGFEPVVRRLGAEDPTLGPGRRGSAIVGEDRTGLLAGRIGSAASGETPTLGSIREFASGPAPGDPAPDGAVLVAGERTARSLRALFDGRRHVALLFDGQSASKEGYGRLEAIAQTLEARFEGLFEIAVVTPRLDRPVELPDGRVVLLDADRTLEARYAATTEAIYVLRPDLHIGYRSQPADEATLVTFLRGYLR